jgi:hypothetical protein
VNTYRELFAERGFADTRFACQCDERTPTRDCRIER